MAKVAMWGLLPLLACLLLALLEAAGLGADGASAAAAADPLTAALEQAEEAGEGVAAPQEAVHVKRKRGRHHGHKKGSRKVHHTDVPDGHDDAVKLVGFGREVPASPGRAGLGAMRQELQELRQQLALDLGARAEGSTPEWDAKLRMMETQIEDLERMLAALEEQEARRKRRAISVSHAELQVEIDRLREAVHRIEHPEQYSSSAPPDAPGATPTQPEAPGTKTAEIATGNGAGNGTTAGGQEAPGTKTGEIATGNGAGNGTTAGGQEASGSAAPLLPPAPPGDGAGGAGDKAELRVENASTQPAGAAGAASGKAAEAAGAAGAEGQAGAGGGPSGTAAPGGSGTSSAGGAGGPSIGAGASGSAGGAAGGGEDEEEASEGHGGSRPSVPDVDSAMPYGDLEPFGREDTAQELTQASIRESDSMVDQLERAEVAEERRAVFRALTRLRGAAITSFDGIARAQTGTIDEYSRTHQWRSAHPLRHLADEEADVSKWAFPTQSDF